MGVVGAPRGLAAAVALVCLTIVGDATARTIRVGPEGEFATIGEASRVASDGDLVEIEAGTYVGDVATWTADDLTLRGVGGRPMLDAGGTSAGGKAIWVIQGDRVLIESIAFANAHVADRNGAGIRHEGGALTVRDSEFLDNEMGILTGNGAHQRLVVEASSFVRTGRDDVGNGQGHGLYAGAIAELVVRGSSFTGTKIGHHLKSRAKRTVVTCNRFADGAQGTASFAIDLPGGGDALIMGNSFHKGVGADNPHTIAYGNEGMRNEGRTLIVVFNTFVDDRASSPFIRVRKADDIQATIANNIFVGRNRIVTGGRKVEDNLHVATTEGTLAEDGFELASGSAAIDAAGDGAGVSWQDQPAIPTCEFVQPVGTRPRPRVGPLDMGAYEYTGP